MDRKTFLRTTVAGAAALVAAPGALVSCASPKEKKQPSVPLRLSFQEGVTPGETLAEKLDFMEKLGIVGFEPGGKGLAGRVPEIREALQGRDIKVSAICAGFDGFILAEDPAVKARRHHGPGVQLAESRPPPHAGNARLPLPADARPG